MDDLGVRRLAAVILQQALIELLDPRPDSGEHFETPELRRAAMRARRRDAHDFLRSPWADTIAAGIDFDLAAALSRVYRIRHRGARVAVADRLRYGRVGRRRAEAA